MHLSVGKPHVLMLCIRFGGMDTCVCNASARATRTSSLPSPSRPMRSLCVLECLAAILMMLSKASDCGGRACLGWQ